MGLKVDKSVIINYAKKSIINVDDYQKVKDPS
jgi:hypothetical protein